MARVILGHLALWWGSALLVCRRWRKASVAGTLALVLSLFMYFGEGALPPLIAICTKLASMAVLTGAGFVGARRFQNTSRASVIRSASERHSVTASAATQSEPNPALRM